MEKGLWHTDCQKSDRSQSRRQLWSRRSMGVRVNGISLCSGIGGLELGLKIALGDAYRCVCYIEREGYAAATLVARMEDKALDSAPIWDDLATFDGGPWRGKVDIVSGGFPCQPASTAGRRKGKKTSVGSGLSSRSEF